MTGQRLKPHELRRVGGLPVYVYNILCTRIRAGKAVCYLKYAAAYKELAHLLDEYGMVHHSVSNQYAGKLTSLKADIDKAEIGDIGLRMYIRLHGHLKKNRLRNSVSPTNELLFKRSIIENCKMQFGFTILEFTAHYESLFTDGMTWDRVMAGDIQMDHTIPVRIFDLTSIDGVHAAYALSNTKPMWRGDNARKGVTSDLTWLELFGEGCIRG